MSLEIVQQHRVHGGTLRYVRHQSAVTGTPMRFSLFLPEGEGPFPLLVWLSGLTCTEDNFTTKAGAYGPAAVHGLAILAPDTSPRGEGVADDPAYDLGQGAGFYLDATQAPWTPHFQMETYVTGELLETVVAEFPIARAKIGVSGHSMGGHGALTIGLSFPDRFKAISAFAPIVAPSRVPWGQKALGGYLGEDHAAWRRHDAVALIEDGARVADLLVDQGETDPFLAEQLRPDLLDAACKAAGIPLTLRLQPGYDHSYYTISTFMEDHLRWHSARL